MTICAIVLRGLVLFCAQDVIQGPPSDMCALKTIGIVVLCTLGLVVAGFLFSIAIGTGGIMNFVAEVSIGFGLAIVHAVGCRA